MALRVNHIFPECFVDTNMMKTLLHLDGVNHQHSCSKVLRTMSTEKHKNGFAIGIIDDDKKKPSGYFDFVQLSQIGHLRLMKHKNRMHYLIVVSKAAEDFILSCANEMSIQMTDYNLPSSLDDFKTITKKCESDKEPRIKKLINAIKTSSEMARLERTLQYLQIHQLGVNENALLAEFNK